MSSYLHRRLVTAIGLGEQIFLVAIAVPYCIALYSAARFHPNFVLAAANEIFAAILILLRRRGDIAVGAMPVAAAYAGSLLGLLARPGGDVLLGNFPATALMLAGLLISVWAKLALRRSFGLIAANRGVKSSGPYRIVRHPMYVGYWLTQVGFLLQNAQLWNFGVYALAWIVQLLRIAEEEKLLSRDASYRSYSTDVPWKLVPRVF